MENKLLVLRKIKGPIIWAVTFIGILAAIFAAWNPSHSEKIGMAEMIIIGGFVAFLFGGTCFVLSNFIPRYDDGIDFLPAEAIAGVLLATITCIYGYVEFAVTVCFLWIAGSTAGFLLGLVCSMTLKELFKLKIFPEKKMIS